MTTMVLLSSALTLTSFLLLLARMYWYHRWHALQQLYDARGDRVDSLETDLVAEIKRRMRAEAKIADALKMVSALRDSLPRSRGAAAVKIFEDAEVYAADPPTREYGLITVGYDVETSGDGTMTLRPYRRDQAAESSDPAAGVGHHALWPASDRSDLVPPNPELFELLNFSREAVRRVNQPKPQVSDVD